jgi:hypothetical protein
LPPGATDKDVKATYKDGILEVRIPVDRERRRCRSSAREYRTRGGSAAVNEAGTPRTVFVSRGVETDVDAVQRHEFFQRMGYKI